MREGMAAALRWRDHDRYEVGVSTGCYKCFGSGIVRSWTAPAGRGGKTGPCPKCQKDGARRFLAELARQTFDIDGNRARRFARTFGGQK